MIKSFVQFVKEKGKDIIMPIEIGRAERFGEDCFIKVDHVEQGRWFHKIYISIIEGKLHTNKIIKILNDNIFEFGGTVFIKGNSLKNDLVNGHEII